TQLRREMDATVEFLQGRLAALAERIDGAPTPDPSLAAQCAQLRMALEEATGELGLYVEQYHRLTDAVAAAAAGAPAARSALAGELSALREELASPLFATADYAAAKAQLVAQADALETMLARNPDIAGQGVSLLRERIHREAQWQADRREQRAKAAEEMRLLVGDTLAKLQALASQTVLPDYRAQAEALLAALANALATAEDELERVRGMADEAAQLYEDCRRALEEQAVSAYISEQVREVLLSLGYQVSLVPGQGETDSPALIAAADGRVGVSFHTDGAGHLKTEVVAFSEQHAVADAETKEKVCALVERVLVSLRDREWYVREKYRITVKEGERLQVVTLPGREESAAATAAAQHSRKVDEV
ncbi:MAG TPA: hypothetical protein PK794_14175, partial [Armatimonadota bacterium]|nr:hypothetical protein [Armatimonadota bacterium]